MISMVFIRVKKVKGFDYYYLVKSQWDSKRKISTQHTIKYLGKASDVNLESIPTEYQNDPKILSLLSSVTKTQENNSRIVKELQEHVFESLKAGDIEDIIKIAVEFKESRSLSAFYESILKPIMYEIGYLWQNNAIDIGIEHVCSNMANKTIHKLTNSLKQRNTSGTIMICTPDGELHNIACNMFESVLLEKGYNIINISPSIPTESVISQMRESNPMLVLISVTLQDNVGSALRLISRLTSLFQTPILMGGLAIDSCSQEERRKLESTSPNVTVIVNSTIESLVRTIRTILKSAQTTNGRDQRQEVDNLMAVN